jgi:hypothetical protein
LTRINIKEYLQGEVVVSSNQRVDSQWAPRPYMIALTLSVMVESIGIFYILVTNCGFDLNPPILRAVILLIFATFLSALILLYTESRRKSVSE